MRSNVRALPDGVALWWITIHFQERCAPGGGVQSRGIPLDDLATCGAGRCCTGGCACATAAGSFLPGCGATLGPLKLGGGSFSTSCGWFDAQPPESSTRTATTRPIDLGTDRG